MAGAPAVKFSRLAKVGDGGPFCAEHSEFVVEFLVDSRIELTKLEHLVKTGQMPDSQALELFFLRSPKQLSHKNRR